MKALTTEQERVLGFIVETQRSDGRPPTVREIADGLGYKSPNNAAQHLRLIEQKGYIKRHKGTARGIEMLVEQSEEAEDNMVRVPIVGRIAAGLPITAIENVDGSVAVDRDMFGNGELLSLRVAGDSMVGIGINDGDLAVIRRQANVEEGEVAAVIVDDEATLKRVIRWQGNLILRAENPAYEDIVVHPDKEVQIVGKLTGVVRKC